MNEFEKQNYLRDTLYNKENYFKLIVDSGESINKLINTRLQKYKIKKLLHAHTPNKSDVILDLGCSFGMLSFMLSPYCNKIIGVDYSDSAISIANDLKNNTSNYTNIEFKIADCSNLECIDSASIDCIYSSDLVEHIYPDVYEKMIEECYRVLKPNGKLIIFTPNDKHYIELLKNKNIIIKKDMSHVDYKSYNTIFNSLLWKFKINYLDTVESHLPIINIFERVLKHFFLLFGRRWLVVATKWKIK